MGKLKKVSRQEAILNQVLALILGYYVLLGLAVGAVWRYLTA